MATTLRFTIPDAKAAKAKEGFLRIYPNTEKKEDKDGKLTDEKKYTDTQWIKEKIRRIIIRDIHRGLKIKAREEAEIETDNSMVE